jgi:hypothetical protein
MTVPHAATAIATTPTFRRRTRSLIPAGVTQAGRKL